MANELADPYSILGLSRMADADDLKRAYRKLSLAWHPDRHASGTESQRAEAERRFKLVNQAYVAIGEVLRTKREAEAAASQEVTARSDSRIEAIRSVVTSAALRVVPNVPRRDFIRIVSMVEFMLLDTLAVGDRALPYGFEAAVREAMEFASLGPGDRANCLNVLDTAVDDLQWRGKGADPKTWQTLLQPLDQAMHPNRPAAPPPHPVPASPVASPSLLRPEPEWQAIQVGAAIVLILLLLPFVPMGGLLRVVLLLIDLGVLGYATFAPHLGGSR